MKIDLSDEHVPLLIRTLEHYDAYLKATSRHDSRYLEIAEQKMAAHESARTNRPLRPGKISLDEVERIAIWAFGLYEMNMLPSVCT